VKSVHDAADFNTALMVYAVLVAAAGTTAVAATYIPTAPIAVNAATTGSGFENSAYSFKVDVDIRVHWFAVAAATAVAAAVAHTDVMTAIIAPTIEANTINFITGGRPRERQRIVIPILASTARASIDRNGQAVSTSQTT
jgi:hypothetical protein